MPKKHVFLSYCRENQDQVKQLHDDLEQAGETVWWDQDILPGQNWKLEIKKALDDSYAVICCFSQESEVRYQSGIYPELRDAIRIYRTYAPGMVFLIPARLSNCTIPSLEIDDTTTLDHLQYVDLFPQTTRNVEIQNLLKSLRATPDHP